ncbi:uncharacterized protein LOC141608545 [Silene latifolia]|uniref:uncharacterized protein LOC141608545 n=1 Tax=Silene latifolia TaxID=37657 RepID=UPI003D7851B0
MAVEKLCDNGEDVAQLKVEERDIGWEKMACSDNKKIFRIQNLDRVSQLPDPIILSILSRLPLEDSARASILSKTWKNYCESYPILYFDHNLFALQSGLASVTEVSGGEPNFTQLREMFMDGVDHRLTNARHLDSPIRKLALNVAFNDSTYFSRVDNWIELVKQINVEDLCITVQTVHFLWHDTVNSSSIAYEFPVSMLTSKHLRKVSIRGCKLGCDPISRFWSLERLCLSHVVMDYDALDNLTRLCQGIETLILENCSVEMRFLNLSKFPNLKKAVIGIHAAACASIKEIDCAWCTFDQPTLLKDFTSTFPLLEEGVLQIHDTNTFKAASNLLKNLILISNDNDFACVKEVYIDCPSLIYFDCWTKGLEELHLNSPKLREFNFAGTTVPKRVLCSSVTELEKSSWNIIMRDAYDTTWLMNLREFIVPLIGNKTTVSVNFKLPMATFQRELVEAIEVSPRHNFSLYLELHYDEENVAALVDGILWIIRPTTFIIDCRNYYVVKYLCENLVRKAEESICDEQLTHPCWMLQLESFDVEYAWDVPLTNGNLADLPEECRTLLRNALKFKFQWFVK